MARESITLSDQWKFVRHEAALGDAVSDWESVTIPHTWNALDGQNGKKADPEHPDGYYRGPAWYARDLQIPPAWKGQRIFIRFEAASLVSDVYFNGEHLGQHRGAFAAFCYELTPLVKFEGENVLRVRVDNSHTEDVMPLSGDFTVFGGIYRPVHLFTTAPTCITPLDHGSSGVYVTTKKIEQDKAELEVEAKILASSPNESSLSLIAEVADASGAVLHSEKVSVTSAPSLRVKLVIPKPHLWQGLQDPYLYTVRTRLMREGAVVDEVEQHIGLRTAEITADRGFLLNGKPYPIHGVNRHQERQDKGWALSHEDHVEDFEIIRDMGANAVRLAHYQQSQDVHDICDRMGFLTWEEIPNVERVSRTEAFAENARLQMTEMLLQGYNSPSIIWRGIFNELNASWIKVEGGQVPPEPVLASLAAVVRELDPSRLMVAASWTTDPLPMHKIADWQCFNTYPGWYWGKLQDFATAIDKGSVGIGGKRTAISEYGAGGNPKHHEEGTLKPPKPDGQWHPEEYQALAHETDWGIAKNNPKLWGIFVWAMFDFASDKRDEGAQPGINDKGLVSHDRKLRKDAFYFYQANWTQKPMVYVAARRSTPRKQAKTEIKVYSNCESVDLWVNGKSLGAVKPDSVHIARWKDVALRNGSNTIEAKASSGATKVSDACEWALTSD